MSSFFIPSLLMVSLAIEPLLMESLLMESLPIVSFLSWAKAGVAAKSNATVAAAAETTMASAPASAAAVNLVVIACPFRVVLEFGRRARFVRVSHPHFLFRGRRGRRYVL